MGGALADAAYDETTGEVAVPSGLAGTPWRLVFQEPGKIPHELQWSVSRAIFVEPIAGRLARAPVSEGSGYRIAPSGRAPGSFTAPPVLTTRLWFGITAS